MTEIKKDKILIKKDRAIICFSLIIIIFFASIFSLSGCSSKVDVKDIVKNKFSNEKAMNDAVKTVDEFFKFLKDKSFDKAYELISAKDKAKHDIEYFKKDLQNMTQIVEVEINWVEVKNNVASVGIDLIDTYDGEEKMYKDMVVSLIKEEDGSFKINFWD